MFLRASFYPDFVKHVIVAPSFLSTNSRLRTSALKISQLCFLNRGRFILLHTPASTYRTGFNSRSLNQIRMESLIRGAV